MREVKRKMISDKYSCIFIHIPKTAGQSIEKYFLDLHGKSWAERETLLLAHNEFSSCGPERLAHLTAEEYVKFGYVDENTYYDYFKFSIVRNPWDRLVSEYNYRKLYMLFSFRDYILFNLPEKSSYTDEYRHVMPQYHYIFGENGECKVDFIGRFENIKKDFSTICQKLGLLDCKLPHQNKSPKIKNLFTKRRKHYSEYYDHETKEIVEEMYKCDIVAFNYEFQTPPITS